MAKHVVLIENDHDFRWVLTLMLETIGYHVTSFSEVENIDKLIADPVDFYIVDENLPGINGHTLCIILKSKPATKNVPVILISGSSKLEVAASLCDANAFLAKPFTQDELQNLLLKFG